jgi:hypothetical protein
VVGMGLFNVTVESSVGSTYWTQHAVFHETPIFDLECVI